jgi:competence ComEA-like helix-hairpin-helix protein
MNKNPLLWKQLCGACMIVLLAFMLYSARWSLSCFHIMEGLSVPDSGDEKSGPLVIVLAGDSGNYGVYFLPEETEVSELLEKAGVNDMSLFDKAYRARKLHSGDRVTVKGSILEFERMDAAALLALDIPIDINESTVDDFMLIPGIGCKTATAIVELREKRGSFSRIEELKMIRGFGGKKLDKIKEYLFIKKS